MMCCVCGVLFYYLKVMKIKLLDNNITLGTRQRNPQYKNVDGVAFKIGEKVKVLDNPNKDETFNNKFVNKIGEVYFFEYCCVCGQSFPADPMIGVRFGNGKTEEFWCEELKLII